MDVLEMPNQNDESLSYPKTFSSCVLRIIGLL